jgi:hypothetical protein
VRQRIKRLGGKALHLEPESVHQRFPPYPEPPYVYFNTSSIVEAPSKIAR